MDVELPSRRRRRLVAQVVVLGLLAPACLGLVALALHAASPPTVEASAAVARPRGVVGKTPSARELRGSVDWGERGVMPVRLALVCDPDDRTSTARRARREGVVRIRLCLPGS